MQRIRDIVMDCFDSNGNLTDWLADGTLRVLLIMDDFAMATSRKKKRLLDAYRFPAFRPLDEVRGIFGDPMARIVMLVRSKKQSAGNAARRTRAGTTARPGACAICPAATHASIWRSRRGAFLAGDAAK